METRSWREGSRWITESELNRQQKITLGVFSLLFLAPFPWIWGDFITNVETRSRLERRDGRVNLEWVSTDLFGFRETDAGRIEDIRSVAQRETPVSASASTVSIVLVTPTGEERVRAPLAATHTGTLDRLNGFLASGQSEDSRVMFEHAGVWVPLVLSSGVLLLVVMFHSRTFARWRLEVDGASGTVSMTYRQLALERERKLEVGEVREVEAVTRRHGTAGRRGFGAEPEWQRRSRFSQYLRFRLTDGSEWTMPVNRPTDEEHEALARQVAKQIGIRT